MMPFEANKQKRQATTKLKITFNNKVVPTVGSIGHDIDYITTEDLRKINNNRRILIVDDEPFNIIGLTIIL